MPVDQCAGAVTPRGASVRGTSLGRSVRPVSTREDAIRAKVLAREARTQFWTESR